MNNLTILQQNPKLFKSFQHALSYHGIQRKLSAIQATLEYVNVYCLTQLLHVTLEKNSITEIIIQYSYYNDDLYQNMININACYDRYSENNIDEEDLELLMLKIQHIYEIIKINYGDIVFDESLEFCQKYNEYIAFLDVEDQCIIKLRDFMCLNDSIHWYSYMETVASLNDIFNQYLNDFDISRQEEYLNEMIEIIRNYN